MSDLVERLRRERETDHLCVEAADTIERLRGIEQFASEASRHERDGLHAEIERLRAALFDIAYRGHDNCRSGPKSCIWLMQVTARRALEPKP